MKIFLGVIFSTFGVLGPSFAVAAAAEQVEIAASSLYRVYINPFEVKKLGLAMKEAGTKYFPKRIGNADTIGHYGEVSFAIETLAQRYGVVVESMTSAVSLSFEAYLTHDQMQNLRNDSGVVGVEQINRVAASYSAATTLGDSFNGGEVTTWAKSYVNANQTVNVTTPLYLVDGGLENYGQFDINIISQDNIGGDIATIDHAGHVAGIIGAKNNGYGAVGINPGQPIKLFGMNSFAQVPIALDKAVRNAEATDQFAVANVSLNKRPTTTQNSWQYSGWTGRSFRAASNRLFITQSAGNQNSNACDFAYSHPGSGGPTYRVNDGIMVVGGVDRAGSRYTDTYNDFGGSPYEGYAGPLTFPGPQNRVQLEMGSNTGPCVEAWAPAHEITSVVYNFAGSPNYTRVLSGTSFASPIVGALASRYGSISTRPIERENYIRRILVPTGSYAAGLPINVVQYSDPAFYSIPKVLSVVGASSPTNPNNLDVLYDGKFFDPVRFWEANSSNGSILFDLGQMKTIVGIRVTVRTALAPQEFENYPMGYAIGVGNSTSEIIETAYYTEPSQADNAPVYIDIPTVGARYVRLNASNQHSPLAFSEVEIYGY